MTKGATIAISSESRRSGEAWIGGWPQSRSEFEVFLDVFMDRLAGIAFHRLGNLEEAEDVVQEVMVKAYADREKLRRVRRVGAYLYRMTVNACIERRRGPRVLSLEEIGAEGIPDGQTEMAERIAVEDEMQQIQQYLSRLPESQAEVIRLRVLDGYTCAETAEITGSNIPTVKSRFHYGLQKLRRIVPHTREECA